MTSEQVLTVIRKRGFFYVHRYRWSDGQTRRIIRKLVKRGILVQSFRGQDTDEYTLVKNSKIGGMTDEARPDLGRVARTRGVASSEEIRLGQFA